MPIEIKHRYTGKVIYTHPGDSLTGADLRDANLTGANLAGADLRDADLTGAILTRTILRSANLTDADLRNANLRGADLTGAFLTGAILPSTYIRNKSERIIKIRNTNVRIIHTHSDGEVSVYVDNGKQLQSFSHDEHENAVVCFEEMCDMLEALRKEIT